MQMVAENIETYQETFQRQVTDRVNKLLKNAMEAKPSICIERARIWTESYRRTEGDPEIIRRAKALSMVLDEMSIYILDGELIVGNHSYRPRGSVVNPEYHTPWLSRELNDKEIAPDKRSFDHHEVSDETRKELWESVMPYWEGKTIEDKVLGELSPEVINAAFPSCSKVHTIPPAPEIHLRNGMGHQNVNYAKLINKGALAIIGEAREKLASLSQEKKEQREFYEAVTITYEALIRWSRRYAELAQNLAATESDPVRVLELEKIAEICRHVPANPARTFWEALQTFWFIQCIIFGLEQDDTACSPGRMDQYLYPYYEADLKSGNISREEALELVELMFIKTSHMSKLWDYTTARYFGGFSLTQCIIVGGVKPDGTDATNELSYIFLDAEANTGLYQPEFAVRIHKRSPEDFLMKTVDVIKLGRGKPKLFVDESAIPMLLNRGVSLEEARDYCVVGCVEVAPSGSLAGWTNAAQFNLAKCLELAVNGGVCLLTGEQIGPKTQDPKTFSNINEVLDAYGTHIEYFTDHMVTALNCVLENQEKYTPFPFTSSLIDGCFETGRDFTGGGAKYKGVGVNAVAVPDVGDSLAALESLVFTEKKVEMETLVQALRSNFEGYEDLRQMLLNRAPKFGNDNDLVDDLTRKAGQIWCHIVEKYRGPHGESYWPGLFTVSANVPLGMNTGALPYGRKATTPLANGGISPTNGSEKSGPTAILQSAAKLDHIAAGNGTLLNLRFSPSVLKEKRDLSKFVAFLRTYAALGGFHVQFNVINSDILRKAQKNPKQYKNLLIRVAGYSAYFTELSPEVQEDVINRTIHEEMA